MGASGVGKEISTADVHLQRSVFDPAEKLLRAGAKEFGRVDVVEEGRIANLDALRQAHDVERSGTAKHRSIPAEGAGAPKRVKRSLESLGTGAVIDDIHAFTAGKALDLVGKLPFGIYDDVFGARLFGDRHLIFG